MPGTAYLPPRAVRYRSLLLLSLPSGCLASDVVQGELSGWARILEAARVEKADQLITEVARSTTKAIARFKARKPEPPRRAAAPLARPAQGVAAR